MRWMRGLILFFAGTIFGIVMMQASAASRESVPGVRLNHVGFYVRDLDESIKFYTKTMGFREAFSYKNLDGIPTRYLQINRDTFLELQPADASHPLGVSHIGIWADDLKATVTVLQQKGAKIDDPSVGATKALRSNIIDPNGIRLELVDLPPGSLQRDAIDNWK